MDYTHKWIEYQWDYKNEVSETNKKLKLEVAVERINKKWIRKGKINIYTLDQALILTS
jgi:hypothetical protein